MTLKNEQQRVVFLDAGLWNFRTKDLAKKWLPLHSVRMDKLWMANGQIA